MIRSLRAIAFVMLIVTLAVTSAGLPPHAQARTVVGSSAIGEESEQLRSVPQPPQPSHEHETQSASDPALRKLAPELRPLASARSPETVLVTALMREGTKWQPYFVRAVPRRPLGGLQWVTGEISGANLLKLAGLPGVISVISFQSYAPVPAPGMDDFRGGSQYRPPALKPEIGAAARAKETLRQFIAGMTPNQVREKLRSDSQFRAQIEKILGRSLLQRPALPQKPALPPRGGIQPATIKVRDVHGATAAWTKGYTGTGVIAAVVDTGVDFAHPDLQGTQARVLSGPYAGWPFAYDTLSGLFYALGNPTIGPDTYWDWVNSTWYAHTLPVTGPTCNGITCTANLKIDFGSEAGWGWPPVILPFVWPDKSKSGKYYYTVHPDYTLLVAGYNLGLGYAATDIAPPAVIVADETTAGVYDTVYVDVDFDQDLTDEKPMRKGDELAGADLYDAAGDPGTDGVWDLSAGMLAWIADGTNPPPGTNVLFASVPIPQSGRLLAFIGDDDSHGTNCAGDIAAQGVITDPEGMGPINPYFGGLGDPVLSGMAPGAKVAAFQHGYWLPFDSWTLTALGFDGIPSSGDEAQISSNSWGASATINDGWDATSRFAHWLAHHFAPNLTFLVATGNGGHGYGTVTEPTGGPIIDVGASTQYGTLLNFEPITDTTMLAYGDVQPWSNRGPTTLGDVAPDVVAVGAWGTGANPLNIQYGNGQAAYNIFGGTSMATPIAAGNLALVYHAFRQTHGRWPTWEEAKTILLASAHDLGYDVLTQGSGNVNADRATDIAAGDAFWAAPAQWVAGSYRGTDYPAFPAIMHPGNTDAQVFTITNPMTAPVNIAITATTLVRIREVTFTLNFASFSPPPFTLPTWITDITNLIQTYSPDLVRAQVIFPYDAFDPDGDYTYDQRWRVLFYGWKDLNRDGNLWTDTNGNGRVDAGEIDAYEYNRFTYGYPSGTYLEASLGRDSYTRWLDPAQTNGDGIFFGVQRRTGNAAVTLQVRLTFYKKAPWGWINLPVTSLNVPAGGQAAFSAQMNVPANARLGTYEGALEISTGGVRQVIPVVVHVAANSPTFAFGAMSLNEPIGSQPYDNGHLFGGFDWSWRYEAGDWKIFYYDLPNGTAAPGHAMIVDTRWVTVPTDVDTWIYGAASDLYSISDPAFFGPQSVEQVGGSNNSYTGVDGIFLFDTATGGPREVVGGTLRDGLGFITLHNVLYAGTRFGEPIVGQAYQVEATPSPVVITTSRVVNPSPLQFGGAWVEAFTTTYTITEGITATVYGLSRPQTWINQPLTPGPTLCDWSYTFTVSYGGLIEASVNSPDIADIDLYLYRWTGTDWEQIAASTTATAQEQVRVKRPADGQYRICVDNFSGTPGHFNLLLRVIQGNNMTVSGLPTGPIRAATPITFTVTFTQTATPGTTWEGLLYIGLPTAPAVLEVPITVNIITPTILLTATKQASAQWAWTGDVFTYTITLRNLGTDQEFVDVTDSIPPRVELVPGSGTATKGSLFMDLITRQVRWSGWVNGGETVILRFRVQAQSGRGWAENTAVIMGRASAQRVEASARTFINGFRIYFPALMRDSGP